MEVNGRKNYLYVCLGTIAMGLFAYFNVITGFFLSDDFTLVEAIATKGPFAVWTLNAGFFRPLISLCLFGDHFLYKLNATGYHVTNIIIHALNAFFVFLVTNQLLQSFGQKSPKSQRQKISLFASMIFLVLPSHTEAVSWISGRTDLIATFFCLVSFFTYLLYRQILCRAYLIYSLILFVMALLSKESVITYPFMLAGYEICVSFFQKKQTFQWSRLALPIYYVFTLLVFLGIRWVAVGAFLGGYGRAMHLTIKPVKFFLYAIFFSLRAYLPPFSLHTWYIILPLILLTFLLISIFCIRHMGFKCLWRKLPPLVYFLIAAFFITLVPGFSLGIMPMDTRGERLLYLSSVFSSILLAYLVVKILHPHKRLLWGVSLSLLTFFQFALYRSNTYWKEGGDIAQNILQNLQTVELHHIYIVNLPDNLRGAYIYRNGIQQAVSLFSSKDNGEKRVHVFSYQFLQTPHDNTSIFQQADRYSYRIQLENPEAYFINIDLPEDNYTVTDTKVEGFKIYPKNYIFSFKKLPNDCKLYFYSDRQLHSICENS